MSLGRTRFPDAATPGQPQPPSVTPFMTPPVTPLRGAFGVEVCDVDLSHLTDEAARHLGELVLRHGVVVVPDQILDPGQQVALAARFGRVTPSRPGCGAGRTCGRPARRGCAPSGRITTGR